MINTGTGMLMTCLFSLQVPLDQFFDYINSIPPNISVTLETEDNRSINFLDLTISVVYK